jgi:hypothetical protein
LRGANRKSGRENIPAEPAANDQSRESGRERDAIES